MKTRGFTLIEVCIVLAIIAILAALLVPSIRQANNPAERYQQICVDGVMYLRDKNCSNCATIAKVDVETLQPQRCTAKKP